MNFFEQEFIHEEDLEEFLLEHGYDIYDDIDDIENRITDENKVRNIADDNGYTIDECFEGHEGGNCGYIYVKAKKL